MQALTIEQQKKEEYLLLKRRRAALGRWQLLLRSVATRLRLKNTYEDEREDDGGDKCNQGTTVNPTACSGPAADKEHPCNGKDSDPVEANNLVKPSQDISHVHEFKDVDGRSCDTNKSMCKVCYCGFKLEMEEI